MNYLYSIIQLFEFEVSEGYPLNMVFGDVSGMDADIGSNAIIFYHLLGSSKSIPHQHTNNQYTNFIDTSNTTCADHFCVNHETGGLYLREMLDRETQAVHTISLATSNLRELQFNVRIIIIFRLFLVINIFFLLDIFCRRVNR